jgi:hypothetical protein
MDFDKGFLIGFGCGVLITLLIVFICVATVPHG